MANKGRTRWGDMGDAFEEVLAPPISWAYSELASLPAFAEIATEGASLGELAPSYDVGVEVAKRLRKNAPRLSRHELQNLAVFVSSSEGRFAIRTMLCDRLMPATERGLGSVRTLFVAGLDQQAGLDSPAYYLCDALLDACTSAAKYVSQGEDSWEGSLEARRRYHREMVLASDRALRARRQVSQARLGALVEEIAAGARSAHGEITPPSFEGALPVPIDELYEPPEFSTDDRATTSRLTYEQVHRGSTFLVVVGDPGAGKSTFAEKACVDLARQTASTGIAPVVVVLREYDSRTDRSTSIERYLRNLLESRYGARMSAEELEALLVLGRLTVVLDGLDELTDLSRRRSIRDEVQAFATRYPAVSQIVTSRRIGYEHAPLDRWRYSRLRLVDFSDDQVASYARRWFRLDLRAQADLQKRERPDTDAIEQRVRDFMTESSSILDLRRNALMLALLCRLYRGEGSLPRNRSDVYDKCARMLFETWDKQRGIKMLLPIEDRLSEVLQHLAHWIYTEQELQLGVTEAELVHEAAAFLEEWLFEDAAEARRAARSLIEFCKGRAWVLSDYGATEDDQPLFRFTHRTFLEFFAAQHLVSGCDTPEQLLAELGPRLEVGEWDVVGQLAVQLAKRNRRGAADEFITRLLDRAASRQGAPRAALLNFALRLLSSLAPKPGTTRHIVTSSVEFALELAADRSRPSPAQLQVDVASIVPALAEILREARKPAYSAYAETLRRWIDSDDTHASVIGISWEVTASKFIQDVMPSHLRELHDVIEELRAHAMGRAEELMRWSVPAARHVVLGTRRPDMLKRAVEHHGVNWMLLRSKPRVADDIEPALVTMCADSPELCDTIVQALIAEPRQLKPQSVFDWWKATQELSSEGSEARALWSLLVSAAIEAGGDSLLDERNRRRRRERLEVTWMDRLLATLTQAVSATDDSRGERPVAFHTELRKLGVPVAAVKVLEQWVDRQWAWLAGPRRQDDVS